MSDSVIIARKSTEIEPGYVWAPYVPMNIQAQVHGYESKTTKIKRKINKLFGLKRDISDTFHPNKVIQSRYSTKSINPKLYKVITVSDKA